MALSYTKNTWTDTNTSGTAITAAKLNAYETAISSLVTQVNTLTTKVDALTSDSGVKYLVDNGDWKVAYRKIGKWVFIQLWDYGTSIGMSAGKSCILNEKIPSGYRPKIDTFLACDGIGMQTDNSRVLIKQDVSISLYFNKLPDYYFWVVGVYPIA